MLIDTHAHFYYDQFEGDLDSVILRAKEANLRTIINIGADLESSKKAVNFKNNQINFYASIGIHPHEVSKITTDESIHKYVGKLEKLYHSNAQKIVAIGECGLDYFFSGNPDYSPSPLSEDKQVELQRKLFLTQINLAKKLNLPLIIHCRDAWNDIFLPELQGLRGVFHSFTGTPETAKKALDLGFYLGFTCIVTYPKNDHLRQIIKDMPLEKILTETDCPYLPPQTQRGQRNEPANVTEAVKVIAHVKGLTFEKAAQSTYQNAQKLFRLT